MTERDESFTEAYDALFDDAYRAALRVLGDRARAQELAQETMVRAYVHWPKLRTRPEGWVVTTAFRLAIDVWRRQQRAPEPERPGAPGELDAVAVQRVDLVRGLASLPRRQREVAVLRYLADRSEAETAEMLGCSVGSVKRHASRATAALRNVLTPPAAPMTEAP